ncbi:MAG: nucleotidyltransferase domain-containing protein [Gammaproteobacteria bacterium]|nr:nucleotidyltransferase domain-containing protein [Gammaproteobacteria bacterium]
MPIQLVNDEMKAYYQALEQPGQDIFGDLLENIQTDVDNLSRNPGPSGERYKALKARLQQLLDPNINSDSANRLLISILKEFIYNTLTDHGIEISENQMELCVSGSLARNKATPFSDIDCFMIFSDDLSTENKRNLIEAYNKIVRMTKVISKYMFSDQSVFAVDPLLERLNGTQDEILEWCSVDDVLLFNVENAKCVSGSDINQNTTRLRKIISNLQVNPETAHTCFDYAMRIFRGPEDPVPGNLPPKISIKSDLLRPLEYILQGLRVQSKIDGQEFSSQDELIDTLKKEKIGYTAAELIRYIYARASKIRFELHVTHQAEHDNIDPSDPRYQELKELSYLVGWLRGALEKYLVEYQKFEREEIKEPPKFILNLNDYLSNNKHLDQCSPEEIKAIKELQKNCFDLIARNELNPKTKTSVLHNQPSKAIEHDVSLEASEFVLAPLIIFRDEVQKYLSTHNYLFFDPPPSSEKIAMLQKLEEIFSTSEKKIIDSNFNPEICMKEIQSMINAIVEIGFKNAEFQQAKGSGAGRLAEIFNHTLDGLILTLEHLETSKAYPDLQKQVRSYSYQSRIFSNQTEINNEINAVLNNNHSSNGSVQVNSQNTIQRTAKFENSEKRLNIHILQDQFSKKQNNQKPIVKTCSVQSIQTDSNGQKAYRSEQYFPKKIVLTDKQLTEWASREVQNLIAILDKKDKTRPICINNMPAREAAFIAAYCECIHHDFEFTQGTKKPNNNLLSEARKAVNEYIRTIEHKSIFKQENQTHPTLKH